MEIGEPPRRQPRQMNVTIFPVCCKNFLCSGQFVARQKALADRQAGLVFVESWGRHNPLYPVRVDVWEG